MKIRDNKGITIVSLVTLVLILIILSSVIIVEMNSGDKFKEYQYMKADIEVISDSILIYYNKYASLPTKGEALSNVGLEGQDSVVGNYFEIDLSKLGDLTLNYGKGEDNDIYIVNEQSHEVYYLKGIEYEGETKYK